MNYALERLLYRLAQSQHREHFVLKGALLFRLWFQLTQRPTREFATLRQTMWQAFLTRSELTAPPMADVLDTLRTQCWPLLQAAAKMEAP